MEVKIISKEVVKPSSPTPDIYKFSLLDQSNPPTLYPIILYFLPEADSGLTQKINILKESLSQNLTRFYPFAGRVKDRHSVDCKDGGIPFSIAEVRGNLEDFLIKPNLKMTMKLLQNDNSRQEQKPGDHVCEIQVNRFECGGLAVSVVISHCVADAVTLCTFLRSWAAAARSTGEEISPDFNIGKNVFPPLDVMDRETMLFPSDMSPYLRLTKYVTKRYVFDTSIIAKLKERARSGSSVLPSSVVAVSAFIWKVYMNLFTEKSDLEKPFTQMQVVNLRRTAVPALPDESFGNMYWLTAAQCTSPADSNLEDLAGEVKRAIKKIDSGFVQALMDGGYHQKLEETKKGFPRGSHLMGISSWCRFGWYDIDFGWGKPVWISLSVCGDSDTVAANGATFMDTRFNDGIEAWMTLAQDYVASFEENEDIKNYVLIDPPVPCR